MESIDYLSALRRRWAIVLAAGLTAVLAVLLLGPARTPGVLSGSFTATATLVQPPDPARPVQFTALLVTTGPVPEMVAEELDYSGEPTSLAETVEVESDVETNAVRISATSPDAAQAALLANTFAEATVQEMDDRAGGRSGVELLERAVPQPADTGVLRGPTSLTGRLLLALVVGLVLGGGLALLLERFDTRVRDRSDVQRAYRVPVLAEVPLVSRARRAEHSVIVATEPASASAEAYRSLRSSVQLIPSRVLQATDAGAGIVEVSTERGRPQLILVTSARSGEGKTTSVVNLAAAMAEGGQRVLVLDADFRRPEAHRYLDVPNGPGLSDLIHAGQGAEELLALSRPTAVERVRLVTAGTMTDQPPALPTRVAGLLAEARRLADVVIVDSAPMLLGNDTMDLMPYVDTVLVTCRSGRSTRDQIDRASDLLARMRVPVVGAALIGWRSSPPPLSHLLLHRSGPLNSSERSRRGVVASDGTPGQ